MSSPIMLETRDLKRRFTQGGKTLEVLKGINLTLAPGELVALVGASGSGKSTLLQCAGMLDAPSEGSIFIDGEDASSAPEREHTRIRREKLGFIYQFHHLLPEFTALENVALAARISGASEKDANATANALLDELGLSERSDHVPARLSGGEQQRVAIARALAGGAKILLADEPTGNLDQETAGKVFDLFLKAARSRGLTALVATHDPVLAARMDRQYSLVAGHLQAPTPPAHSV